MNQDMFSPGALLCLFAVSQSGLLLFVFCHVFIYRQARVSVSPVRLLSALTPSTLLPLLLNIQYSTISEIV